MSFNSIIFLSIFMPIVIMGYYFLKGNNLYLLVLSCIFYYWTNGSLLASILLLTLINYLTAIFIDKKDKYKKYIFISGIVINIAFLSYFKYMNFFISNINAIFRLHIGNILYIVAPLGISFIIFKSISYISDVYTGKIGVETNIIDYCLYILFFPQVISGPITRYADMRAEIKCRKCEADEIRNGFCRFIAGLAKKIFIANYLGDLADQIWNIHVNDLYSSLAILGAFVYMLQIYFDFSSYSDMAIGLSRIFGFSCLENFNYPYISRSISEFWRRWHISLSTWFRDYIYIPLGGSRRGNLYFNIFVVFLITGLWHGSSWHFVIWGMWNGIFNIFEKYIAKKGFVIGKGSKLTQFVSWLYTMGVVFIGWILFRAPGIKYAIKYILVMAGFRQGFNGFEISRYLDTFNISLLVISIIFSFPFIKDIYFKYIKKDTDLCVALENIFIIALLIVCIVGAVSNTYTSFIYFQF